LKIGVISDTHNHLEREVTRWFSGVDHILHAGDVGLPKIIHELEAIAPVTAVMGNTDDPAFAYPMTELLELAGRRFLLHHIVNPYAPDDSLKQRIQSARAEIVVFGHTHKPFNQVIGGILFFNPGYAGKQRFGLARSVAILECDEGGLRAEFLPL
jgi:putative phosphoesterase